MTGDRIHGRFHDRWRTYVVTAASTPDTIRVFAGDPVARDEICTISNLSRRAYPSWSAKWNSNLPDWKRRLCDRAIDVWRDGPPPLGRHVPGPRPTPSPTPRPVVRSCEG